jgi:hypothetical protein
MNWEFYWYNRVGTDGNEVKGVEEYTKILNLMYPPFRVFFRSFAGGDSPPFESIDEQTPLQPGSILKFVDTQENEIDMTLIISGSSKLVMYQLINTLNLENLFSPAFNDREVKLVSPPAQANSKAILTGDGKLRVRSPGLGSYVDENGNVKLYYRDLICRCLSGFKIDEAKLSYSHMFVNLYLRANYPYWRSSRQLSLLLGTKNTNPIPDEGPPSWVGNLNLQPGGNQNYQKLFYLVNNGTVPTYPIWTFHGPGRAPYLSNLSTGKTLSFNQNCFIDKKQDLIIDV